MSVTTMRRISQTGRGGFRSGPLFPPGAGGRRLSHGAHSRRTRTTRGRKVTIKPSRVRLMLTNRC
jgi:hypothetical protein